MTELSRDDLLRALGGGDEVLVREALAKRVATLVSKLAEIAQNTPGTNVRTEEERDALVAQLDPETEPVLIAAMVLTQYGSERALPDVARALQQLAEPAGWERTSSDFPALVCVLVGRLLWSLTAIALYLDRLTLLPLLNRVMVPTDYGEPVAAVADNSLRYAALYRGEAGITYKAFYGWLSTRESLSDFPMLSIHGELERVFAEADLILALRVPVRHERKVFSAGAGLNHRPAEQRLIARLADAQQRDTLSAFYGPTEHTLEELLAERYRQVAMYDRFASSELFGSGD